MLSCFFFFNDTATTEIYTLSLHDALPIFLYRCHRFGPDGSSDHPGFFVGGRSPQDRPRQPSGRPVCCSPRSDRKSTRLNSSHANISYAVFCLKKKKNTIQIVTSSTTLDCY